MVELINKVADIQLPFYKKSPTIFFHQEFLSLECFCFGLIYRAFQSVDILKKRNLIQKKRVKLLPLLIAFSRARFFWNLLESFGIMCSVKIVFLKIS